MKLPSPVDLWSSLLRERLLLMKGAAASEEVWRDEKLRLLQRRLAGLAGRDACLVTWWPALPGWLRLPLVREPPTLLPLAVESLPLPLRLFTLPYLTPVLDVVLPACLPPLNTGTADAACSFGRENKSERLNCDYLMRGGGNPQKTVLYGFHDDI